MYLSVVAPSKRTHRTNYNLRDFLQQQAAADELSRDCDPAVRPGLVCCSNLESACEETYLLLALALLTLRAEEDTQI